MNTTTDDLPPPPDGTLDADADFIAIQLRRAREQADISVIELSRLTGLSKTVLHGYERGRTKPGAREIRFLSIALNVSPNWLVFGNDEFDQGKRTLSSIYRKIKVKPGLGAVLASLYVPMVAAFLDEAEMESLLTLVEALVRAKHAETADKMLVVAEEISSAINEAILPNGELAPGEMDAATKRAQIRIKERMERMK